MTLRNILVTAVVADILLTACTVIVALTGLSSVTEVSAAGQDESLVPRWVDSTALGLFVMSVITGWVGILRFWNPGRFFYLAAWVLALFSIATTVARVEAGWSFALGTLTALCGGFLISLVFCSELRSLYAHNAA